MKTPSERIRVLVPRPISAEGDYVLYWMTMYRRLSWNYSLDRAIEISQETQKPLLIVECLLSDYPWACDRFHHFILDGMRERAKELASRKIGHYVFLEKQSKEMNGFFEALLKRAVALVSDDFPCFIIPKLIEESARTSGCRVEVIDSNGIYPMRVAERAFVTAFSFRAYLQKEIPFFLLQLPQENPFLHYSVEATPKIPQTIEKNFRNSASFLARGEDCLPLSSLPISHKIHLVSSLRGTRKNAISRWTDFRKNKLVRYADERNQPDTQVSSGLSPYLHFGAISPHEILHDLLRDHDWDPSKLGEKTHGKKSGFWGLPSSVEAFLDQLITWRELGFNACVYLKDYDKFDSLPSWAKTSLHKHEKDERNPCYSLEEFDSAETHDEIWNAAQTELRQEGIIHNYLRMLWGKKILEWSSSPRDALEIMVELNNKYALDGRDPNSYSGIFWILGRYDRPWGPERPIFGTIRYMSSENTRKKLNLKSYLSQFGEDTQKQLF